MSEIATAAKSRCGQLEACLGIYRSPVTCSLTRLYCIVLLIVNTSALSFLISHINASISISPLCARAHRPPMALDAEAWARSSLGDRIAACKATACSLQALAAQHGADAAGRDEPLSPGQAAAALFQRSLRPALARLGSAPAEDGQAQDALLDVVDAAVECAAVLLSAAGAPSEAAGGSYGVAADAAWAAAAAAAEAVLEGLAPGSEGLTAALAGAPARQQRWLAAACSAAVAALQASLRF